MPPARQSQAPTGSSFASQLLSHHHQEQIHQHHHPHHHQPAYGLLEPQDPCPAHRTAAGAPARRRDRAASLGSALPPPPNVRRHKRKSSSFGRSVGRVVPAWDDVEARLDTLKDRGAELGATIGALSHRLTDAVPGVRGSIVFLSILQSNIQLSAREGSASPFIPPIALPPPPPLQLLTDIPAPIMAARESDPNPQIPASSSPETPELVYETPRDQDARIDALKLVADSVAQMRQTAASVMIASPLFLLLLAAGPAISYYFLYHDVSDWPIILTTTGGLTMAALVSVRWAMKGYLLEAERINWKWLGDDHMLVARFGKDIIGTLVYRITKGDDSSSATTTGTAEKGTKAKRKGNAKAITAGGGTAEIRAWTIRRRERGHGVGKALLEAAAKICVKDHQCEDLVFANNEEGDRAGSRPMMLPMLARATGVDRMQKQKEERGRQCLRKVVEQA